jgi:uncharacterized protein (TIGR02145 family)
MTRELASWDIVRQFRLSNRLSNLSVIIIAAVIVAVSASIASLTPSTHATPPEQTTINLKVHSALSLTITNCDSSQTDPTALSITTSPNTNNGFAIDCQDLAINLNTPGYSLSAKASDTNTNYNSGNPTNDLLYTGTTSQNPIPSIPATTASTASPASLSVNKWGFAVTSSNVNLTGQPIADFDSDSDYSSSTDSPDSNYANLSVSGTPIYSTTDQITSPDNFRFYYATKVNNSTPAGTYATTITYTLTGEDVPCQWNPGISFEDAGCVEPNIVCVSGPAFKSHVGNILGAAAATSTWQDGDNGIVTDSRNGQDYCIGKLADENIWMLTNLKLGTTDPAGLLLTPDDTNILSDWTLPRLNSSMNADYFDSPRTYSNPSSTDGLDDITFYGYYYNWCAATAGGTGTAAPGTCTNASTPPNDAAGDICPANWRLPKGGNYNDPNSEFAQLIAAMAGESFNDYATNFNSGTSDYYNNFQFGGPFKGVLAGARVNSGWSSQGNYGDWWSSVHNSSDNASYLRVMASYVNPDYISNRKSGRSIRCLLQ